MSKYFNQSADQLTEFLDFIEEDLENVRRVIDFCSDHDLGNGFMVHAKSETVDESAKNVGINKEKIVKTLVFKDDSDFFAVLCPGNRRVSESKLEDVVGNSVDMANPKEVKNETGYQIGGVSPFDLDIQVFMEKDILQHEKVKPASGSRVIGITVNPKKLKKAIKAETLDITE